MQSNKINYVELPACDLEANKAFFKQAFGWSFVDYGNDYTAFLILEWMGDFSVLTSRRGRKLVQL